MRMKLLVVGGIIACVIAVSTFAQNEEQKPAKVQIVQPDEDVHEFTVTGRSKILRIPVSTAGGGKISMPDIKGPAKMVRSASVQTVVGDEPLVGALNKEFEFSSTGAGEVVISFRIKSPTGDDRNVKYTVQWK
jgi:hypothetical protein